MLDYPEQLNSDSMYFRVKRGDKYCNICFTDLTEEEQRSVLANYDRDSLLRLLQILTRTIRNEV